MVVFTFSRCRWWQMRFFSLFGFANFFFIYFEAFLTIFRPNKPFFALIKHNIDQNRVFFIESWTFLCSPKCSKLSGRLFTNITSSNPWWPMAQRAAIFCTFGITFFPHFLANSRPFVRSHFTIRFARSLRIFWCLAIDFLSNLIFVFFAIFRRVFEAQKHCWCQMYECKRFARPRALQRHLSIDLWIENWQSLKRLIVRFSSRIL